MTLLRDLAQQLFARWRGAAMAGPRFDRALAAGKFHLERGELDAARQHLAAALAARPHAAAALEFAYAIAEREGNYAAVAKLLRAARTAEPRQATAARLLGQTLRKKGDFAGATRCFQHAPHVRHAHELVHPVQDPLAARLDAEEVALEAGLP